LNHRVNYILVGHKACSLCLAAESLLKTHGLAHEWQDASLYPEYAFRIPVLLYGSTVVAEGKLSEQTLWAIAQDPTKKV
jgi:hypothetical protein